MPGGDATPALTQNVATQNVSPDSTTTYRVSTPLNTAGCQSEALVTVDVSLHRLQLDGVDESCGSLGNALRITPSWVKPNFSAIRNARGLEPRVGPVSRDKLSVINA